MFKINLSLLMLLSIFSIIKCEYGINLHDKDGYYNPEAFKDNEYEGQFFPKHKFFKNKNDKIEAYDFAENMKYFDNNWNKSKLYF